jgi:thiol-disulfide isomerase/thioredoxin
MIKIKLSGHFAFLLAFLLLLTHSKNAVAQTIPPFRMQLTNGKNFTAQNVSKTKPVIIIYFAPDCEHCRALIKAVLKKNSDFKKAQIILVSFEPLSMIISFEKEFNLKKYPNFLCGTETPTFYFKSLFNLVHTPFTALYDKRGKLVISYKEETPVDDLILHLKKI